MTGIDRHRTLTSIGIAALLRLAICCGIVLCYTGVSAQTDDVVNIVKEYDAKVKDAEKVNLAPGIPEIEETRPKLSYKIPPKDFKEILFEPNPLKPLGMVAEKMERFNSSYLKIGFGSQLTPLVELAYNDNKTKNLKYGLFYNHLSQYGFKIKNQKYSDDEAGIYTRYFPKTYEFSVGFRFHNIRTHFYGSPDTVFDGSAVRQNLRDYDLNLGFKNLQKNKYAIDYTAALRGNYMQETYGGGSEYFINGKVGLGHNFKKYHTVSGGFEFDISNYKTKEQSTFRDLFFVNAGYVFNNDDWKAKAAFTLAVDGSKVYPLPDLQIEKRLYEHKLIAYAGWLIRYQKNSFKTLSERNNYVLSNLQLNNTRISDFYAGLKGTLDGFSYNLRFAYRNIADMPFYYTDYFDTKRFYVAYDSKVTAFNGNIELGYNMKDKLRILLITDINSFSPGANQKAWYEPVFKASLKASYNIEKKFIVGLDIYGFTTYYGFIAPGNIREIKGTADINLNLEYLFSKRFTLFGALNNIAHQHYERWAYYPVYGINGLVGAKFSF